jgi:hypothetical protein
VCIGGVVSRMLCHHTGWQEDRMVMLVLIVDVVLLGRMRMCWERVACG